MLPVAPKELLMFVEKSPAQSSYDPLTILLPDPEDPEGFQAILFSDRPLTCDQRDNNFYLPSSLFRQGPETCKNRDVLLVCYFSHILIVGLPTVTSPLELKKNNLLCFPVCHPSVWPAEPEGLFHLCFVYHG